MKKTLYDIVGVVSSATTAEIEAAATIRLASIKQAHEAGNPAAETDLFALKEAVAVLRDPVRRAGYDGKLAAAAIARAAAERAAAPAPRPASAKADASADDSSGGGKPIWLSWAVSGLVVLLAATWMGYRGYNAEIQSQIKKDAEAMKSFDPQAWIRKLPATSAPAPPPEFMKKLSGTVESGGQRCAHRSGLGPV